MIFGKHINKYYRQNWYLFLVGIIALIFVDIYQLEIPRQIGFLIDGLSTSTLDEAGIYQIVLTIFGYAGIIILGRFVWRIGIFGASRRFDYGLRNDMFAHCEKLSVSFYNENKTGALMAHYTNDLDAVRMGVGPGMIIFVDATFFTFLISLLITDQSIILQILSKYLLLSAR